MLNYTNLPSSFEEVSMEYSQALGVSPRRGAPLAKLDKGFFISLFGPPSSSIMVQ